MNPTLLAKYGRAVPRYTSYPTAPHFGPAVDAACYASWLETLEAGKSLSLYLHVPFCRSLCWFCGCSMRVINHYDPIRRFLDLLHAEIALVGQRLGAPRRVSHIHFGGGTPNTLEPRDFATLMGTLRRHFELDETTEIAVEIDPRVLTAEQAEAFGDAGVTRASLGVQDFAPAVQKAINRIQTYETTAQAIERLRTRGVKGINLDLMYGLPHQTVESVVATVDRTLTLAPDRLAVFGYAHVPWMKRHQRLLPESALPGAAERLAQAGAIAARLVERGYVTIGLDHFARPDDPLVAAMIAGRLNRNFQGYTTDDAAALVGFGPSAIGTLPAGYVQNIAEFRAYAEAIEAERLATARGILLDDDDRMRREIIKRLMCHYEAPLDAICRAFGKEPAALASEYQKLQELAADGLVELAGGWLRIRETGRPFVRVVSAIFDRYLASGQGRHAIAV